MANEREMNITWSTAMGKLVTTDLEEYSRRNPIIIYRDLYTPLDIFIKCKPYGQIRRSKASTVVIIAPERVRLEIAVSWIMQTIAGFSLERSIVEDLLRLLANVGGAIKCFNRFYISNRDTSFHVAVKADDDHRVTAVIAIAQNTGKDTMIERYMSIVEKQ